MNLSDLTHHPTSERLVEILKDKNQSKDPTFFRLMVAFYFTNVASIMRCKIDTPDRGKIPVNMYAVLSATSGFGKGFSMNIIEDQVINQFRYRFLQDTLPFLANKSLQDLAIKKANRKFNGDPNEELEKLEKEYSSTGPYAFSFDSGTAPAFKQLRHKCLMAGAGSLNFICDEIGNNLLGSTEMLAAFLESYDVGKIKQKLIKNSETNKRSEEILGGVPSNMLLFGTPTKLLDGSKTEDEYISMLETGYARRSFFCYTPKANKTTIEDVDALYERMTDKSANAFLEDISIQLGRLADAINFDMTMSIAKDTYMNILKYKIYCDQRASKMPEHDEIRRAEMMHRYFKVTKLAPVYAFIDGLDHVPEDYVNYAICMAEESGENFNRMMNRDRPFMKLAKYLAEIDKPVTQVDLVEDLPYYKGSSTYKNELITYATAWGYSNNIIIKRSYSDGIEFLNAEALKEIDLDKVKVSFSKDLAQGYKGQEIPFKQISKLTQHPGLHWCNHYFVDGYRNEDNAKVGFNLIVLDVDGECSINTARLLLKNYTYHIHTTKRHTADQNRFRIILPMLYTLKMDSKDYKEFMNNIYSWIPFNTDTQTNQRSRKWETFQGKYWDNEGELIDPITFIPKTSKNEERKKELLDNTAIDNIERWFLSNTGAGNRNNQLIRYGFFILDQTGDFTEAERKVLELNNKIDEPISIEELNKTVIHSLLKKSQGVK